MRSLDDRELRLIEEKASDCARNLSGGIGACSQYMVLKDGNVVRVRVSVTSSEDIVRALHDCLHDGGDK